MDKWTILKRAAYCAFLFILYNPLNYVQAIYDPSNHLATSYNTPIKLSNMKTLSWQNQQDQIQMSHNYSRVSYQSTGNPNVSSIYHRRTFPETTTPVPLLRRPRNFYHDARPLEIKRQLQHLIVTHVDKCPQGHTGQIPLTDSCHMFLNCYKGRGIVQPCAPGTLFNPDVMECDHAHKVKSCFSRRRQRMTTFKDDMRSFGGQQQHQQQKCPQGFTGIMPNYKDCAKYIMCHADSIKLIMDCAPGTLFDCRSNMCTFPRQAECFYVADLFAESESQYQPQTYISGIQHQSIQRQQSQYKQPPNLLQNQQNSLECPPGNVGNLLPHPVRCDQYLHCDIGRTHVQPCGVGTAFNPQIKTCDYPWKVQNCNGQEWTSSIDSSNPPAARQHNDQNYDSRFHNGYTNEFNGQSSGQYYGNTGPKKTSIGFNRTSVEYNPQVHTFDSEFHENFGGTTNSATTTTERTIEEEEGGYGYYQVRPTRMTLQATNNGEQQWPPPFPDAVNTDYDYVIDYEELPLETTTMTRNKISATTVKPFYGGNTAAARPCALHPDNVFECQRNDCIDISLVCDTKKDCRNGKDEYNCAESILQFAQTKGAKLAIKEYTKFRNVSITYCAKLCHEATDFTCKSFNFRQIDSSCFLVDSNVAESGLLVQMPTYTYYEHVSHTLDCSDMYRCKNNKCIGRSHVCDGIDDCLDRQDERDCAPEVFGYKLDLETPYGYQPNEGNLVVTAFGRRGYICDDGFSLANAHVACKEVGYASGALKVRTASYYAFIDPRFNGNSNGNSTFYIMDDVVCAGDERYLKDCYFTGWGVNDCRDGEVVGLVCNDNSVGSAPTLATTTNKPTIGSIGSTAQSSHYLCASNEWLCQSRTECLPLQYLCDGIYDCADSSDEWERFCTSALELRLSPSLSNSGNKNQLVIAGRLEVRYHGTWGTVCDDGFKDREATVVCRQLYRGRKSIANVVGRVLRDGSYGPGFGPIWLDQVTCSGNETDLTDCGPLQWSKHNCEHDEDVAIQCSTQQRDTQRPTIPTIDSIKGGRNQAPASGGFRQSKGDDLDQQTYRYPGKCGVRADDLLKSGATFRVLNAPAAPPGSYPWQATISLRSHKVSKPAHWCGGVIISPLHVLTAAHCLEGVKKTNIRINAGDYDRELDEGTEQVATIEDYVQHEEFRQGSPRNNDIAVIKLTEPGFRLTDDVKAICLPEMDLEYRGGTSCAVSGFGATEQSTKKASRQLRAGWIPIQTRAVCKMPHVYGNELLEGMFCAGNLGGGIDACDGDSGGPLACLHEGYYTLFGITSWGHKCGEANKPGVYVKVAYYRQWIQDAIDKLSAD